VWERKPGTWELPPYAGRDPLTHRDRYGTKTVKARGRHQAETLLASFVAEVAQSAGGHQEDVRRAAWDFSACVSRSSTRPTPPPLAPDDVSGVARELPEGGAGAGHATGPGREPSAARLRRRAPTAIGQDASEGLAPRPANAQRAARWPETTAPSMLAMKRWRV
jgi:hypothetical protein